MMKIEMVADEFEMLALFSNTREITSLSVRINVLNRSFNEEWVGWVSKGLYRKEVEGGRIDVDSVLCARRR